MLEVTKEQITESLQRLKEYSTWMYYSPEAIEKFNLQTRTLDGQNFSIKVRDDGNYSIVLNDGKYDGLEIITQNYYVTSKLTPGTLENMSWKCAILNPEVIPEELKEWVHKAAIFLSSAFTRAIAFCFFSKIMPETIDSIANDLVQVE